MYKLMSKETEQILAKLMISQSCLAIFMNQSHNLIIKTSACSCRRNVSNVFIIPFSALCTFDCTFTSKNKKIHTNVHNKIEFYPLKKIKLDNNITTMKIIDFIMTQLICQNGGGVSISLEFKDDKFDYSFII